MALLKEKDQRKKLQNKINHRMKEERKNDFDYKNSAIFDGGVLFKKLSKKPKRRIKIKRQNPKNKIHRRFLLFLK